MKILHMMLDGQTVGELVQDDHGATRVLSPRIEGAPWVSLAFPPGPHAVKPSTTRAYLAGLLPDTAEARDAVARRFDVSGESQFALLSKIGADCPGAIQFLDDSQLDASDEGLLVPVGEAEIAARLRALRGGSRDWGVPGEHWSLGGAQSKIALRLEGGVWHQAEGAQPTSHILKPGIDDFPSQALIEHLSLRTLGLLGLRVADTRFVRFGEEPAIVVERFDRVRDDAGNLRRVPQEDLCQATSTLPADKYDPKVLDVVTVLRGGGASEDTIAEFASAVLANWVLAAPDAHAKNFSIVLGANGVEALTPLYDVSTGLGYPASSVLGMPIGGERQITKVTGRNVVEFAREIRVDEQEALEACRIFAMWMPTAFAAAAAETEAETPLSREDLEWVASTAERLENHCGHVLTMLERV
ncbi:HipA domain-containing protein [Brachybacterium kimchii]|uniref:HipA domain-containing protein n=1 Tax=Brachybacterium kimchii TaxID=2942909 RepID=A0ABY4NB27_9MICO|nr:HipA domain-containing protein [Brachybacterium kimchii]UQN31770.1 HipA domain-containing protein [Brachybacterium kimchii]